MTKDIQNTKPSVIITTHNQPQYLFLALTALMHQRDKNFEIIIAEDGSSNNTKKVINKIKSETNIPIKHVFQQYIGFRAATIRNKGAAQASGNYLIFVDGDSIPLPSFICRHKYLAEQNYFVSGNRILLSKNFTTKIINNSLLIHKNTSLSWFLAYFSGKINRLLPLLTIKKLFPRYLTTKIWQGAKTCNLAIWKEDFLNINGFDENYNGWGYEDSDLVIRLIHNNIYRKDGRFYIPVMHLWHESNKTNNSKNNYQMLKNTLLSLNNDNAEHKK